MADAPPFFRRPRVLGAAVLVVAAGVAAGVTLTCTHEPAPLDASSSALLPPASSADLACAVRLAAAPPDLGALPPTPEPRSTVSVGVSVAVKRLEAEIDKQVPRRLGSARRKPVGSAGEVTYDVTRGGFTFAVQEDRLLVTTPVSVNVSICKPFGPLCPTYGTCTPKLSATVSVPLTVDGNYRLAKSAASYTIREGCSIVGMDVTAKIREIADAQIASVRGQLDKALIDVRPYAEKVLAQVVRPRPLARGGCAKVAVERLEQAKPRLADGALELRVVAHGGVRVDGGACGATQPAELPPLTTLAAAATVPTDSKLVTRTVLSWEDLSRLVKERLRGEELGEGTRLTELGVRGGLATTGPHAGQPMLLWSVGLEGGTCGTAFFSARLRANSASQQLEVVDVTPWPGQPPIAGLAERLASVTVPFPAGLGAAVEELGTIEKAWAGAIPAELNATIDAKLAPLTVTALPDAAGLMLTLERAGMLLLNVR